jgi:hypothetical protein
MISTKQYFMGREHVYGGLRSVWVARRTPCS